MEKLLRNVLVTFTIGFLAIGVILGFLVLDGCGSVFDPDGCDGELAVHKALVIAFLGLGLTSLAAAIVVEVKVTPTGPQDEGPTFPDGAEV